MINSQVLKSKSTDELINSAYKEKMAGRKYWQFIVELHKRGTKVEFNKAKLFSKSQDPVFREISADILGQLGFSERKFQKASVKILIDLLKDSDPDIVSSAAIALGHRRADEAVPFLAKLRNHKRKNVRFGVVFGLLGQESSIAVETLIILSRDRAEEVRDWATFGLGSQIDVDSQEIRNALEARLGEKNIEIRGEALVGLAKRNFPRISNLLKKALAERAPIVLYLEAAKILADPKLFPNLMKIKKDIIEESDNKYFIDYLDEALKACQRKKKRK